MKAKQGDQYTDW